jgi:hypothetical protein
MAKAVDYINVAIVGDFERGYYVSKDDAVKAVAIERAEMLDKACRYLSKLTKFVCCSEGGGVEQSIFTDADIELFKHKMMKE